jgi:hypothetical protein
MIAVSFCFSISIWILHGQSITKPYQNPHFRSITFPPPQTSLGKPRKINNVPVEHARRSSSHVRKLPLSRLCSKSFMSKRGRFSTHDRPVRRVGCLPSPATWAGRIGCIFLTTVAVSGCRDGQGWSHHCCFNFVARDCVEIGTRRAKTLSGNRATSAMQSL